MDIDVNSLSPMMKQYFEVKEQYPDTLLFFRLGDFYEMFFDDAKTASRELEITLTGRDCGQAERAPMCGVPYHSAQTYITRLIKKGYKVAICEQITDPKESKGIVERDVVRIITPGTFSDMNSLDEKSNNYLASVYIGDEGGGVTFADVSTGVVFSTQAKAKNFFDIISDELIKYSPSEIVFNSNAFLNKSFIKTIKERVESSFEILDDDFYNFLEIDAVLGDKFDIWQTEKTKFNDTPYSVYSLGAALYYIDKTQKIMLAHITDVSYYDKNTYLQIDGTAKRNLELTETMRDKKKNGSLFGAIDDTNTSMGGRLLKRFLCQPLMNLGEINARLDAVGELTENIIDRDAIISLLKNIRDIERLLSKISLKTVNAKDLVSLKDSFYELKPLKQLLGGFNSRLLKDLYAKLDPLSDLYEKINRAIEDEPPFTIREGGMIKAGYNSQLDDLRNIVLNSKEILLQIEMKEKEETGIKLLKISYNKVFGYYIEVTKSNLDLVPDRYIRKQTLANCERYITEELKEIEFKLLNANDKICEIEYNEFLKLREEIFNNSKRIKDAALIVSYLDVLVSFSITALKHNYCKPKINTNGIIEIDEGRHPVVEQSLKNSVFVPNDTCLNDDVSYAVITGPNMAGKSTYMRQVALICLMAQMGSFVPAKYANLCVVDKIFTRVGASDDLAMGQSTFMVEMSEVAYILKNATNNSLIVLDEIGRGTSTYDGLSIAWAVCEYITEKIKAKTLFATHYHELTKLEGVLKGVKNYNIAVKKRGDDITFLRRIVEGGTDDSYGIEVAKLAGVPNNVIKKAHLILEELENNKEHHCVNKEKPIVEEGLRGLETIIADEIVKELKKLDITTLTPIEALNVLNSYINKANEL